MDETTHRNYHKDHYAFEKQMEPRMIGAEKDIEGIKKDIDSLESSHDSHGEKIDKNSLLLTKISIGGIVLYMAIQEMGLLEKLQN